LPGVTRIIILSASSTSTIWKVRPASFRAARRDPRVKDSQQGCGPVPTKVVKDAIHEYVELPEDFFATAVDRRIFQRLRWIAQLSMNFYVYPGATHTRFEHSLGAAYVMVKALEAVKRNSLLHVIPALERERKRRAGTPLGGVLAQAVKLTERIVEELSRHEKEAVLAALYHDIGHIMLSHAAESGLRDMLLRTQPYAAKAEPHSATNHEDITMKIVRWLLEEWRKGRAARGLQGDPGDPSYRFSYACEEIDLETVYTILGLAYGKTDRARYCRPVRLEAGAEGKGLEAYLPRWREEARRIALCTIASLLSGNVDVDRADYILRDSVHTGTKTGVYDIGRYYGVITLVPKLDGLSKREYQATFRLGVLDRGVSIVENMLLSRVYLYRDLYLHDVSMIYGSMAARLFALLLYSSKIMVDVAQGPPAEALGRFRLLDDLAEFPGAVDEALSFPALESYLDRLTDHEFFALARRLAGDDYRLFAQAFLYAADREGLEPRTAREAVLAIGLLAKGITERKHWTGLILTGDPATNAIRLLRRVEVRDEVRQYITPLVMLDYATYVAYKREGVAGDGKGIYVFHRQDPLNPTEITSSPLSTVVDKIADKAYSKILVSFAPDSLDGKTRDPQPKLWTVRRGKPHAAYCDWPCAEKKQITPGPRGFVEPVARMAGMSWEEARDMIREAADKAWALARLIESRVREG